MNDTKAESGPIDMEEILYEKQMMDWRIEDGSADDFELSELQQQPWHVMIKPGGYGGLYIQAMAPDGTMRNIFLEINKGNLHAIVGAHEGEDSHAVIQIGEHGTVAVPMTPGGPSHDYSVLLDKDGIQVHKGDIEPGCVVACSQAVIQ